MNSAFLNQILISWKKSVVSLSVSLTFSLLIPASAPVLAQTVKASIAPSVETSLSGPDWQLGSYPLDEPGSQQPFLPDFDDRSFKTVTVPGEIALQLGLKGMDLYFQSKALTLINDREWWYRKRFQVDRSEEGKLLRLVFEGVDYFASVWLNGKKLGDHEGCYVPFSFDVSRILNYGGENVLAVRVTCPWLPKGRGFLEYMKGEWTFNNYLETARLPEPPYFLGPHWDGLPAGGNAVFPMGLWRDVKLVSSGSMVMDDLFVSTRSIDAQGKATLQISGTVLNHGRQTLSAGLDVKLIPRNFKGEAIAVPRKSLSLQPGPNAFNLEVVVPKAQLWWAWDVGKPNLYRAVASLNQAAGGTSNQREVTFGIRTVSRGPDMSYRLNGTRIFLKGGWYPMGDYYGSKAARSTYIKDLELLKAGHMNHLVAFTVVEKPDFYELCDEMGILVFLEFPFNQLGPIDLLEPSSPRREPFVKESLRQLRNIVIQLRNHPSIIQWAAFAEAHAKGGGWGFGREDLNDAAYDAYSEAIGKLVAELAPGAIYHPSLCDLGEQHYWIANAGMGTTGNYTGHFGANTGFVSEYGGIALPGLDSLRKILPPEQLWDERNRDLPRWKNLPIDVSAYAYQTSFEYDGLASVIDRATQFVDRNIRSLREFVEDSQLYQAFLFKYATEAYRRKKYHSINGTRIWAYGEVTPGIRFNFLDYYREPKMGYYYLQQAHKPLTLSFAYEEALESQVAGKLLRIPVWVVNDYRREIPLEISCEILDLQGRKVWERQFQSSIGSDEAKELGVVEWTVAQQPGIYWLRGHLRERGGEQQAWNSTWIKVTPAVFSRSVRVLLIGQRQYSLPIAKMIQAGGITVDVVDETSTALLSRLEDSSTLRRDYDVVWLASFDSIWKLLNRQAVAGLKAAVQQGVGFIHTGGPGSYHGGRGIGAALDLVSLDEVLPVVLKNRNDLVYGPLLGRTEGHVQGFSPIREIEPVSQGDSGWGEQGFQKEGLPGFNEVETKPDGRLLLRISGHPLLATGQFGAGRTVAFTGFTPRYLEQRDHRDPQIVFSYMVDQEFYTQPLTKAYFELFLRLIAAATGESPAQDIRTVVESRDKPLFETLQDSAPARVSIEPRLQATAARKARLTIDLKNGPNFARLVQLRLNWKAEDEQAPVLAVFDVNYCDLLPGESRTISAELHLLKEGVSSLSGELVMEGSNVEERRMPIEWPGSR
ncbi:MAG: sugar-binding domain-containing protein [Acidobacteriota bacterium]